MKPNRTEVNIENHGLFLAPTDKVAYRLKRSTRRAMINDLRGMWRDVFTRRELETFPTYVLAVILEQI